MARKRRMKLKLSRTNWRGSWYLRKGKTGMKGVSWRNKNSGAISKTPGGRILGYEETKIHPYGGGGIPKKRVPALKRFYGRRR